MSSDTSPDVERRFEALLARRSGSDRVRMACDMFDLARALVIANIRAGEPDIGDRELRVKIFERLYASDFTAEGCAAVVARLRGEDVDVRPVTGSPP